MRKTALTITLLMLLMFSMLAICRYTLSHMPVSLVEKMLQMGTPLPTDPLETSLNNLASQYKKGEVSAIDISTVTTFPWDRLYILGDYTRSSTLDSVVGTSWRDNRNCISQASIVSYSDGFVLLIFTNKGIVTHCLAYVKSPYTLSARSGKSGFSPQETLFILDSSGNMILKSTQ